MKSSDSGFSVGRSDFKKRKKKKTNAGRPSSLDEEQLAMLLVAYYSRPYSLRELADMFGVSRMTVWRAVQDAPAFPRRGGAQGRSLSAI